MVRASRSVHVDAQGNECSELDPRVVRMIVAQGCEIDEATARAFGLIPALVMDGQADDSLAPAPAPKRRGKKEKQD